MSNYHGCKGEVMNLIPHYLIDIIYKTVKRSHLEKLQIIQNVNKLMFQVIFIFFDWILIEQIIASSTLPSWGKQIFKKFYLEFWVGDWGMVKKSIDSMHFLECEHHKLKIFSHTCWNIQVRENSASILERSNPI